MHTETYPIIKLPEIFLKTEILGFPAIPSPPTKKEDSATGLMACLLTGALMVLIIVSGSGKGSEATTAILIVGNLFGFSVIWAFVNSNSNSKNTLYNKHQLENYKSQLEDYDQRQELYELKMNLINEGNTRPVYHQPTLLNYLRDVKKPSIPCSGKEGISERMFSNRLNRWFPGCIYKNVTIDYYAPDFVYRHERTGLTIDIEIDEPYVAGSNKPIHYVGADDDRDSHFLSHNWAVVRFSEEQVFKYPNLCCKFIADIVENIIGDVHNIKLDTSDLSIATVPKVKSWAYKDAIDMASNRFRQQYLGFEFTNVQEDEDNELPF